MAFLCGKYGVVNESPPFPILVLSESNIMIECGLFDNVIGYVQYMYHNCMVDRVWCRINSSFHDVGAIHCHFPLVQGSYFSWRRIRALRTCAIYKNNMVSFM